MKTGIGLYRPRGMAIGMHSAHRQLAQGLLLVGFFVLVGKATGLAKEVAIAWRYGVSETLDAYLFVFNLLQYPTSVWAGVASSVIVTFSAQLRSHSEQQLRAFRSELLGATILGAVVLSVGARFFIPWLVEQPWVGLQHAQEVIAQHIAATLAWVVLPLFLSALWAAWTMAANRHVNTLFEGVPALAVLTAVVLAGGTGALVWGSVIGFLSQALLLAWMLRMHAQIEMPSFRFRSRYWSFFLTAIGMMIVGQVFMSLTSLIDQFFAAHLGPGAISTLSYANRVLALFLSLGATSVGRACLPVFSAVHAREGKKALREIAVRWATLLFMGLLSALVGMVLASHVVRLLFERGRFTSESSEHVATVLCYGLSMVPVYFASLVLVYALLSQMRYHVVSIIALVNFVIKVALSLILVPQLGLRGLMLATTLMYLVAGLIALRELRRIEAKTPGGVAPPTGGTFHETTLFNLRTWFRRDGTRHCEPSQLLVLKRVACGRCHRVR